MPQTLQQVNLTQTIERQTPKRDFGTILTHVVASAAKVGVDLVAPAFSGHPVLSAAVSGVRSAAAAAATASSGVAQVTGAAAGTGDSSPPGQVGHAAGAPDSDPASMIAANRQLMYEGAQLNQAYLQLQREMQQESQHFNAVSNVMKVRHDSAKAAINNIR